MRPFRVRITSNKIKSELNNQYGWDFENNKDDFIINENSIKSFIIQLGKIPTRINFQIIDDRMIISEQYEIMMKAMTNPPPRQSGKCTCCGK